MRESCYAMEAHLQLLRRASKRAGMHDNPENLQLAQRQVLRAGVLHGASLSRTE